MVVPLLLVALAAAPPATAPSPATAQTGQTGQTGSHEVVSTSSLPIIDVRLTRAAHARTVLGLVNQARSRSRVCGTSAMPAVRPVRADRRLALAATRHARDMARRDYFAHDTPEGLDVGDRLLRSGYRWSTWAENIAAGQPTPADVVQAWLESPGHCLNIMNPDVTELGVGFVEMSRSRWGTYWVQNFGRPGGRR